MGKVIIDGKPIDNKQSFLYFNTKKDTIEKLGITNYKTGRFNKIDDILECDTGMVVAKSIRSVETQINGYNVPQIKGQSYVMTLDQFMKGFRGKDQIYKPGNKTFKNYFKRYVGQDLNGKNLLISRTGGLGDILISQSAVKYIKEKYPDCTITYATSGAFLDLFRSWPPGLVDKVVPMPYNLDILKKSDYQLLFIHGIENCLETQTYNYYDVFKKMFKADYDAKQYIPTLNAYSKFTDSILIPRNTIAIHMNSSTKLRRYPLESWHIIFKTLIDKGYYVGIIDAPKESQNIDTLVNSMNLDKTKMLNLACVSKSISQSIAIINKCIGTITIDSFFGHVSGALRKPSVCLCGPFPPYNVVGYYENTYGFGAAQEWIDSDLNCGKHPCFLTGQEHNCPYLLANIQPGCLSSINPLSIVNKLEEQIKKVI